MEQKADKLKYNISMKTLVKNITLGIAVALAVAGCDNKPTLYVFNWSDYISEQYVRSFERKHDCHVSITSFDSNEQMYAKLKAGSTGYDICVPSSYQVEMLAAEGFIEELDHSKLPNVFKDFDHSYDSQMLDPKCKYSIPYVVTYTGFLYRKDKLEEAPDSWKVFEDKKLLGKVTLLDDIREVIGAGLMANGYSINSTNATEISKAVETVLKWKENVRKFDAESYRTEVPNASTWLGHGYSSDSAQVIIGDGVVRDDIAFALPKEGFTVAWDELVIMKSSKNKDLAYAFINELYEKEAAKENMEYVCGVMPQKKALEEVDESIRKLFVFPEEVMKNGQVLKSFVNKSEVQELYNKAWDKIKAMK